MRVTGVSQVGVRLMGIWRVCYSKIRKKNQIEAWHMAHLVLKPRCWPTCYM